MYQMFKCKKCGTEMIIPTYQLNAMEDTGRYIACPFGHQHLEIIDRYDSLKECMQHDSYKKEGGKVKQRGWSSG